MIKKPIQLHQSKYFIIEISKIYYELIIDLDGAWSVNILLEIICYHED